MTTTENTNTLALIERAERETPFCECGEPMAPVARDHQVWLECATRQAPTQSAGHVRRALAVLASAGHTRRLVLDPAGC